MNRTRIKICGITREEDAVLARELGIDALGLNFYADSPRCIELDRARAIAAQTGPLTTLVGLFVNPDPAQVKKILDSVPLQVLQFHGDEDQAFCSSFELPWIKAIRVQSQDQLADAASQFPGVSGLLLDAHVPGTRGGTGMSFDWGVIPRLDKPYLLAGGLHAGNVGVAIQSCRPYAVDVSSGVELEPGVKDAVKIRAFIQAVEGADQSAQESA